MVNITGKAFVITGGAGSIGGACARELISKGAIALIFDVIPEDAGKERAKSYHAERAHYFKVDITDIEGFEAACQEALKVIPKGSLFGGVHCAAIAPGREWNKKLTESAKTFQKVLHVNAYGTFAVDAAIADTINSQYPDEGPFGARVNEDRGCIVNIASIVANKVPARCLTYGPSKTCVLGITEAMADFLGPYGIRVNSVAPAIVASGLMGPDRIPYFQGELDASAIHPRRLSEPEEVAQGVAFLIENSMMNDFHLRVDGGWRGGSNWSGPKDPRSNAISLE